MSSEKKDLVYMTRSYKQGLFLVVVGWHDYCNKDIGVMLEKDKEVEN